MNKLPVELVREISKYGNFTLRNGIFIKKYEGDISHMYTINFKHIYSKKNNSISIKLTRKVELNYYFNDNNSIKEFAYSYQDDYIIISGAYYYTYDEKNNIWIYKTNVHVYCYNFERYYRRLCMQGVPYSS